MKKIFFFLLCTVLFAACNDDKTPDPIPTPVGDPFAIAVSDITTSSVKIAITPQSATQAYYFKLLDKATFAGQYNSDAATYITKLLADATQWDAGMTTEQKVKKMTITGKKTYEATKLTIETKYIVFAVGLAPDGTLSTKVITKEFTTTVQPFTIAVSDITSSSAKITVTPASSTLIYFSNVIGKDVFAQHHNSDVATYVTNFLNNTDLWDKGTTIEEKLKKITVVGAETFDATKLTASAKYIALAVGLNPDGTLSTEAITKEFTTAEQVGSGLTFAVNILKTEWDNIDFKITPSNNEEFYFYTMKSTEFCNALSDGNLFELIKGENEMMLPFMSKQGASSEIRTPDGTPFNYYHPNTGYTLLVFGYDKTAAQTTTKLFKFDMRTAKGTGNPADVTFAVTPSDLRSTKMTINIVPSNPQVVYLWDLIDDATYQINKTKMNEYIATYVTEGGGRAKITEMSDLGDGGAPFSDLKAGTTYYVWSTCIDEYGIPTAKVIISNPIKTLDPVVSPATVTITLNKYFNGDEVYAKYPENKDYEASKGHAYVSITFKASTDASVWYGGLFNDDMSSTTEFSDEMIIKNLVNAGGYEYPTGKLYNSTWDAPHTAVAFVKDRNGDFSKVYRETFTFTKAGAAPMSEFIAPTTMSPARISSFLKPINNTQKATIKSYKPVAKKK